jgi:hypothetical protein
MQWPQKKGGVRVMVFIATQQYFSYIMVVSFTARGSDSMVVGFTSTCAMIAPLKL